MRIFYIINLIVSYALLLSANEWKSAWLDPYDKYHISWISDDDSNTVSFVVSVQTTGWIGFGISPNGGMKNSDIVIGWVTDDGVTHFHDRYAKEEALPEIDESQDWNLLESKQNITHTVLKFSRPYFTCDKNFDQDITRDTLRIIYAYGDSDPKNANQVRIHKHHQRGSKSMILVTDKVDKTIPEQKRVKSLIINVKNITIPNKKTSYWCKFIHFTEQPIHAFKYDKYITRGNEQFIHHMSIYSCNHPDVSQLLKYTTSEGYDCTEFANMPKDFIHCYSPLHAWAVGGDAMVAPDDVGLPLGTDDDTTYFILQIHYENPELIADRIDSSGFEFYYTGEMRKYEAFTLMIGSTFDYRLVIPPKQERFHVTAHCDTRCFDKLMDDNGFNVIAAMPHMHNIGKTLKLRHFRDNKELPWIIDENNYDFNYQTFRDLRHMVSVKPGDLLTTECSYNSMDRKSATLGGLSSEDEMCVSMLVGYPRLKNAKFCFSGLTLPDIMSFSGVEKLYNTSDDGLIIETPNHLGNKSLVSYLAEKNDWNNESIDRLRYLATQSKQYLQCYYYKTNGDIEFNELIGYPKLDSVYKPIELICQTNGVTKSRNPANKLNNALIYWFVSALILLLVILISIKLFRSNSIRNTLFVFQFYKR